MFFQCRDYRIFPCIKGNSVFTTVQKSYTQVHPYPASNVFGLLDPEAETKWLEHWSYTPIQRKEEGALSQHDIFTTPHHGEDETLWYTVRHYPKERFVEFIRFTPKAYVVHIELRVVSLAAEESQTLVSYNFTPVSDEGEQTLKGEILPLFDQHMQKWEAAINYYLCHGRPLTEDSDD